ncbi:MAG TPA: phosphatase PAP2 family protein [Bacteroidia bacterium]|nr:phosphatase PAP2 family protein [Bacteroidia bacterium]
MLSWLDTIDHQFFLAVHLWRNSFFDLQMPLVSNRWLWIPLYALLVFLVWKRFRMKSIYIVIAVALLVLFSDQTANLLKNSTKRPRPSYDEALAGQVITPLGRGGNYGFVSGHAANSMAVALFLWLLSGAQKDFPASRRRKWWLLLFPWVILVCWSRVYVGVHFPFDVLGGCAVGALWALVFWFLLRRIIFR